MGDQFHILKLAQILQVRAVLDENKLILLTGT